MFIQLKPRCRTLVRKHMYGRHVEEVDANRGYEVYEHGPCRCKHLVLAFGVSTDQYFQ